MVKREVVGAHYGLRDWLAQRVTAVIMVAYTAMVLSAFVSLPQMDYSQWKALWQTPVMKYATVLFVASLLFHAWVGMRNIFMDYIKAPGLRVGLYVLIIGAMLLYAFWSVQILWSL
jgi:succinate dehydrogenase / fumarate reductase, membrane anchor subunit